MEAHLELLPGVRQAAALRLPTVGLFNIPAIRVVRARYGLVDEEIRLNC
jgi:hypothetical protein